MCLPLRLLIRLPSHRPKILAPFRYFVMICKKYILMSQDCISDVSLHFIGGKPYTSFLHTGTFGEIQIRMNGNIKSTVRVERFNS